MHDPGWRWGPLAAVCLAQMLLMLDVTIVIVALPDIAQDLSGDLQSMQLIIDIYALMLAALLLNPGALDDRNLGVQLRFEAFNQSASSK